MESYNNRHSTIGASIFLDQWSSSQTDFNNNSNNDDCHFDGDHQWKTLPIRLSSLVKHYKQNPHLAKTERRSITLSSDPMEARRIALTAAIVTEAPNSVWLGFQMLFRQILDFYLNTENEDEDEDEDEAEEDKEPLSWWDVFDFNEDEFYNCIHVLQWLSSSAETNDSFASKKTDILTKPLLQSVHQIISQRIETLISGEYEMEGLFSTSQTWVKEKLLPILCKITRYNNLSNSDSISNSNHLEEQLYHIISDCYCTIRQTEIFDIIRDYPDSLPAIIDLNIVLKQTHRMNTFISTLKDTFRKRLLHPGAETDDILEVYIKTIKVLRIIDPTDCLLGRVSQGIKSYLRERGDTVRCIISSLTDREALGGDLYRELQRQDDHVKPLEEAQYDSDEEEEMPTMDWNPSPSIYFQRTSGGVQTYDNDDDMDGLRKPPSTKEADLLSMLVGIYGSNDLFVDEYRLMLADKLLANINFDTDREVHNLELLKIRFGEQSMRQCEIMIRDMGDSKRIADNIHSTIKGRSMDEDLDVIVDAAIVSHIFWPPLQKKPMKNHPRIQHFIDEFDQEYAKYKNPRRLVWFQQLGQVQLELDVLDNGEEVTKEFTCAPLQATLISHFEDNDGCWTAQDLSNETGVAEDVIKKKMGFWINNHVVKVSRGAQGETMYELCSHQDDSQDAVREHMYDDDDDGRVVSTSVQDEEELLIYESFIQTMLSQYGQLPLDRIHNNLKTWVAGSDHKYNKTPHQLSQLLQKLSKDEKIECGADGMYKLLKKK